MERAIEMRRKQYRAILKELELTQSWAGRTLANSDVTGRRWAATMGDIPEGAAIVLRLIQAGYVTREEVEQAKNGKLAPREREKSPRRNR